MNLVENFQIVEALTPQAGAAVTGDYISMQKANHVTVLVSIAQASVEPVAITIEQATAVAGTGTKALATAVPIYLVADTATSDLWVAQTAAVAYTTSATQKHKLVAFEIDAEDLDVANGFDCITVKTAASDATNLTAAYYICGKLRYGTTSLITD